MASRLKNGRLLHKLDVFPRLSPKFIVQDILNEKNERSEDPGFLVYLFSFTNTPVSLSCLFVFD